MRKVSGRRGVVAGTKSVACGIVPASRCMHEGPFIE